MLHPNIVVNRSSIEGTGLIARGAIGLGEIIWQADQDRPRYHIDDILGWPRAQREAFLSHAWQVGDRWYEGGKDGDIADPALYMNHSCDPNTWFDDDQTMSSLRAISAGEEITYDYVMSEVTLPRVVLVPSCRCGSRLCRKVVTSTDYLRDPAVQGRYRKHVMSHVLAALAAGENATIAARFDV